MDVGGRNLARARPPNLPYQRKGGKIPYAFRFAVTGTVWCNIFSQNFAFNKTNRPNESLESFELLNGQLLKGSVGLIQTCAIRRRFTKLDPRREQTA